MFQSFTLMQVQGRRHMHLGWFGWSRRWGYGNCSLLLSVPNSWTMNYWSFILNPVICLQYLCHTLLLGNNYFVSWCFSSSGKIFNIILHILVDFNLYIVYSLVVEISVNCSYFSFMCIFWNDFVIFCTENRCKCIEFSLLYLTFLDVIIPFRYVFIVFFWYFEVISLGFQFIHIPIEIKWIYINQSMNMKLIKWINNLMSKVGIFSL